ncbi:MAG: M28 family peptidase [Armatimonadota bacterium]
MRYLLALLAFLAAGCSAQAPKFDSARAYRYLTAQCDFGPRPVGTPAHEATAEYLAGELRSCTDSVELQTFKHVLGGRERMLTNIVARFGVGEGVLLCAHWDTRPTADEELDRVSRKQPILGANDGASGVAVLLELARIFKEKPPAVPVTIVLFDGEDYGPGSEQMYLGAKYFAAHLPAKYRYGILLDMVGDSDLNVYREENSPKAVVDRIWQASDGAFSDELKYAIYDDHLPLIRAGVPCALVIDFDYPYWHTLKDTPDKCSAK